MTVIGVVKDAGARTGPDGERHRGRWRVRAVDPPRALKFEDGAPGAPTGTIRVELSEPAGGGTQMVVTVAWESDEGFEWMLATGTDAGMTAAAGQIDQLLERGAP